MPPTRLNLAILAAASLANPLALHTAAHAAW